MSSGSYSGFSNNGYSWNATYEVNSDGTVSNESEYKYNFADDCRKNMKNMSGSNPTYTYYDNHNYDTESYSGLTYVDGITSNINILGTDIIKLFNIDMPSSSKETYSIPIKSNNKYYSFLDNARYGKFYGICYENQNSFNVPSTIKIINKSGKEIPIDSFKNNGTSIFSEKISESTISMRAYSPYPFIRKISTDNTIYDGLIRSINKDYSTIPTKDCWKNNGCAPCGAYKTESSIFNDVTMHHSFSIDRIIRDITIVNEQSSQPTVITSRNKHTSILNPQIISDNYIGSGGLGYSKKWAGAVIKLYYIDVRDTQSTENKHLRYSLSVEISYIGIDSSTLSKYYTGMPFNQGIRDTEDYNPVKNNEPTYGDSEFYFGCCDDPSSYITTSKKEIIKNVPPMINIELQAGGGPGASPISTLMYKPYFNDAAGGNLNGDYSDLVLSLPGGGSGAYGSFSLFMQPNGIKPQAVFYIGFGGLADDCCCLDGTDYTYMSRTYLPNIYNTIDNMDGFSSMAVASNISFELEGGSNGSAYISGKIGNYGDYDTSGTSLTYYNLMSYIYAPSGYNNPIFTEQKSEYNGNCGNIHTTKGTNNTVGILIPNNLYCGNRNERDYYFRNHTTGNSNMTSMNAQIIYSKNSIGDDYNIIRLATNNEMITDKALGIGIGGIDIDTFNCRNLAVGDDLASIAYYGRHGYFRRDTNKDSIYAYSLSEWCSSSKKYGLFCGGGGSPSIMAAGGDGGHIHLNFYNKSTILDLNSGWNTSLIINQSNMHGKCGSGGGGGSGVCSLYSSSTNMLDVNNYGGEFLTQNNAKNHRTTNDAKAYDLRGGDGGSGFFNIIF